MGGKKTGGLTARQRLFVSCYLKSLNASQAAREAGYSVASAGRMAGDLMRNPLIKKEISRLMEEKLGKIEVTAERVLAELARIAFFDPRKILTPGGCVMPFSEMGADQAAVISSVEVSEIFSGSGEDRTRVGELKKIKFWNKNQALEKLGEHLGLFSQSGAAGRSSEPLVHVIPKEEVPDFQIPTPEGKRE